MQNWPTESLEQPSSTNPRETLPPIQDGFFDQQPCRPAQLHRAGGSGSASPRRSPDRGQPGSSSNGVNADQLGEQLRRLSVGSGHSTGRRSVPGQRIIDYENAMIPSVPIESCGFKVVKRVGPASRGVQLTDFPNEILTHILSHLHPDSQASVALVSKRFYSLITMPHVWRMAFLRYFSGHESMNLLKSEKPGSGLRKQEHTDIVRSETRYFARLTSLATWRSEYLLRTRLLRGLVRGKPGSALASGIGASTRTSRKLSAVLTYNSKLPWAVTNLEVVFSSNGKKSPRAVHGSADLGVGTMSDPTLGKAEKWGFDDPFTTQQLDEAFPDLEPYGVGEGPAAGPNVMDVSSHYGILSGEGFPGGRAYYRSIHEKCGRYLGHGTAVVDTYADIPKIPELSEAISSVWIAKSSAATSATQSMVGMLTGSTLGVVTSYALGCDTSGALFSNGDMTARWVLSPGVPIIALTVDDQYSQKRKTAMRVWAVALNALGEVFYLTEPLVPKLDRAKGQDSIKNAWHAGRSVYWHLVEQTRRRARTHDTDKNVIKGTYSPRSPADAMNLSKEQLVAEAREMEKFLRHKPSHFRKACDGWDMRRRLEVDFANDDGAGAGEIVIVIASGWEKGPGPSVTRYIRSLTPPRTAGVLTPAPTRASTPGPPATPAHSLPVKSIFGGDDSLASTLAATVTETDGGSSTPRGSPAQIPADGVSDWVVTTLGLLGHNKSELTASALDLSFHAVLTHAEDPLWDTGKISTPMAATSDTPPTSATATPPEIPGRRARMCAVGTKTGCVLVWNVREPSLSSARLDPVRVIQTESPEISCLALNGLYLVHGGSDGLVQAWDPLTSTQDPLRTLNARPSGRVPRHMLTMNPALRGEDYSAARAIALDLDPTILRGVVSFGAFLRYWTYSATGQSPGRKRRLRHSDVHGRLASRRQGGKVAGYIAAETAELRREQEHQSRELARLRNRFGVGGLTEEEAIRYAQMISEESFMLDEQRRTSASDTGSAADASFDTASSFSESTASTMTPEPSVTGVPGSSTFNPPPTLEEEESEYEMQVQQALRLSLLEGVDGQGRPPRGNGAGDYEVPITYKTKPTGKGARSSSMSTSASPSNGHLMMAVNVGSSSSNTAMTQQEEDDLALAIELSLQEHGTMVDDGNVRDSAVDEEEFPALDVSGKGKGKARV
ncbi:hypothetical protein SODALDRAFT_310963 [Sodiomyces alkalinus F11]|uniref:F-box domain-containing protein n=1 Tax=Sodiomyces alkalinus (strain CBS 110278 / VKM F-3762 / F11) TaxID=1314773 RepID=A0A3N2PY49_SODAK|nr:hypothetical protein SODALDRAFT_310963 [Sodiomyces alkalinus F11]ROT39450.1 hypothetical protein SODALDRAFT_310963 [Sodiomyces alkalinus F11]